MKDKELALNICKRFKKQGLISEIEENSKYSFQALISCPKEYEDDLIFIRDRIKYNFEKLGYRVDILGSHWLKIICFDVKEQIDYVFKDEIMKDLKKK